MKRPSLYLPTVLTSTCKCKNPDITPPQDPARMREIKKKKNSESLTELAVLSRWYPKKQMTEKSRRSLDK